jgi:DNA-binding transcriptional regulator YiaG
VKGNDVRRIRERLALTQTQLGKKLGVHWSAVSRWENGHTPVPQTVALALKLLSKGGR